MEQTLNQITDYLLVRSWHVATLVPAVACVSYSLRNRSAHVRYLLWLIVLAQCLAPPLLTIPLAILPQGSPEQQATVLPAQGPLVSIDTTLTAPASFPAAGGASTPSLAERLAGVTASQWFALAWIAGASTFLLTASLKAARTARRLGRNRMPLSAGLQADVDELVGTFGIQSAPAVWLVEGIGQPFVWGLPRGGIYLPANFRQISNPEHRRSVLMHELSHVLRFDSTVNLLQMFAQAVFWFHPLVWWANRRIRQEREKCCDEMVIARSDTLPKDYGSAIVSSLIAERRSTRPLTSLAVAGPVRNIEDRIRTIMKPDRKFHSRPGLSAVIGIMLLAAFAAPTTFVLTVRRTANAPDRVGVPVTENTQRPAAADTLPPDRHTVLPSSGQDDRAQIMFDCRFYEVPPEFALAASGGTGTGRSKLDVLKGVRYAELIEEYAKATPDATKIAAPRMIIVDGHRASVSMGSELPYTADYEEPNKPGEEPKRVVKYTFEGLELNIVGRIGASESVKLEFEFTQRQVDIAAHSDSTAGEIQTPIIAASTITSVVSVDNRTPVLLSGLKSTSKTNTEIVLVVIPTIIRDSDAGGKQAITGRRPPGAELISVAREYVKLTLEGRSGEAASLTYPSSAAAGQSAEMLELPAGQEFEIERALAGGNNAMVVSAPLKTEHNEEGHLLLHLVRNSGRWLIDDINFASPQALEKELSGFREKAPDAKSLTPAPDRTLPPPVTAQRIVRVFQLKHSNPEKLAGILPRILDALGGTAYQGTPQPDAASAPANPRITIAPNNLSNSLIVSGAPSDIEMAERLIKALDVPDGGHR